MSDRDEVINHLKETADYFRECRKDESLERKDKIRFLEMQNVANALIELLKEPERDEVE